MAEATIVEGGGGVRQLLVGAVLRSAMAAESERLAGEWVTRVGRLEAELSAVSGMLRDAEGAQATLEARRCLACDLPDARAMRAAHPPPVACA